MTVTTVLFVIAAVLFVIASIGKPNTPVHLGWLGAFFLALGLAL
jgi:hypothetical protein